MGAGDLLRKLDGRVVPVLARGAARLSRGARRLRGLTLGAVVAVSATTVALVWAGDRGPAGDRTVGEVVRVGVAEGDPIPEYVAASRAELEQLAATSPMGEVYALVTLDDYFAPDRLTPVIGGVSVASVYGRVPLPQVQTEIVRIAAYRVPEDVMAGMDAVAARKEVEAATGKRLAALRAGDAEEDRRQRAVHETGAEVAAREAAAYRGHCACVYAAVVRATPGGLSVIAGRPEVRAVDPAPEVRRLDRAVFLPPLPEQTERAAPPGGAPVPGDGRSPAVPS